MINCSHYQEWVDVGDPGLFLVCVLEGDTIYIGHLVRWLDGGCCLDWFLFLNQQWCCLKN